MLSCFGQHKERERERERLLDAVTSSSKADTVVSCWILPDPGSRADAPLWTSLVFGTVTVLAHCKSRMISRLNTCYLEHTVLCFSLDCNLKRIDGCKGAGSDCDLVGVLKRVH